jgi:O-methyltransferase involved in polyketide biosynthesis
VNFAEGLETQRFRLQNSRPEGSLWITVDLPPSIWAREQFILPDDTNLHIAASVLDTGEWMHLVPGDKPVFFTAQGLFMYLKEEENRILLQKIAEEFPSSTIWFDSIAKWLSDKAISDGGWMKTKHYKVPPLPFGANKDDAPLLIKSWVPNSKVSEVPWPCEKGSSFFIKYVAPVLMRLPIIRNFQPGMVMSVKFPPSPN